MKFRFACGRALILLTLAGLLTGCRAAHYRKSADREVYGIIAEKEEAALGHSEPFTIDTPYSGRDPKEIPTDEIVEERLDSADHLLTLPDALRIAVESNRQYQLRKENLYLAALSLSRERYEYRPHLFAGITGTLDRAPDGMVRGRVNSRVGAAQLLRTGGSIGVNIANDVLRYYTGDPSRTAISVISVNLLQPLLRGRGAVAIEGLTQAERDVIYEVRAYSHFQNAFALDIVAAYLRLLQQQDGVRNEFNNYQSLIQSRDRAQAQAEEDRLPEFQVDQARQDELRAQSRYIVAVERYLATVDQFKVTLGLPLGHRLKLDDRALEDIRDLGLLPVPVSDVEGYEIAIASRLDLLNEIDRFEDSKRRIDVAADRLKADFNLFADASLQSQGPVDYARFDINDWRGSAGLQLNLPVNRLGERNTYRASLINFERQLRSLSLTLDTTRDAVRQGLRTLEQARQTYEIQLNARDLADRRVESANMLLEYGRAQIRDLLEAQNAQLQARNAVTQALVDYHLARLRLLLDLGQLNTDIEQFWLEDHLADRRTETPIDPDAVPVSEIVPPDQLFGEAL